MNIFEQASKKKIRFESSKGQLTVEQLWDLPLKSATGAVNLDDIARVCHAQAKKAGETISFVDTTSVAADPIAELKLEIVKHVIGVVKAENEAKNRAAERARTRQEILALLDAKDREAMHGLSREELLKKLEELG